MMASMSYTKLMALRVISMAQIMMALILMTANSMNIVR